MKKLILIAFLLSISIINAQFTEVLSSDRPGQALSVNTVGKNVFQIQAGIDYFDTTSASIYPSSYFRYGISEKFELNSSFILSGINIGDDLESVTIGARYQMSKLESELKSSLQFSYDFSEQNESSQLTYNLGGSFTNSFGYTVNLGLNLDEDFSLNTGIYAFNFSYALNDKFGVFLEPFGTFLKSDFQLNIDTGFYYVLNNNFQIDFQIGESDGLFLGTGITWRVPFKRN